MQAISRTLESYIWLEDSYILVGMEMISALCGVLAFYYFVFNACSWNDEEVFKIQEKAEK